MIIRNNKEGFAKISLYHLKEKEMSLKAKGLLTIMLSLPDDWVFSSKGLEQLSSDGRDGVNAALKELEKFGYLKRRQRYDSSNHFCGYEYDVYEKPFDANSPYTEIPSTEKPITENPHLYNIKKYNTKEYKKKYKKEKYEEDMPEWLKDYKTNINDGVEDL